MNTSFSQSAVNRIIHLPDSLLKLDNYLVYKSDTFNFRDEQGKIQGEGIQFELDSIVFPGLSSYTLGYHDGSAIATCQYHEEPTNVYYKIKGVSYGQYKDNLKIGIWTEYWPNGERWIELNYLDGIIQGKVKVFYETVELMYVGEVVKNEDTVLLKKYSKKGLLLETIEWWLPYIRMLSI